MAFQCRSEALRNHPGLAPTTQQKNCATTPQTHPRYRDFVPETTGTLGRSLYREKIDASINQNFVCMLNGCIRGQEGKQRRKRNRKKKNRIYKKCNLKLQNFKVSRCQGFKVSSCQGFKVSRREGIQGGKLVQLKGLSGGSKERKGKT
eukprot:3876369-Karenia_brevis.AAC.1